MASRRSSIVWRWVRFFLLAAAALYALALAWLAAVRFVPPPVTGVQIQRRVEAWRKKAKYQQRARWTPLESISPHLQHAVVAAEDARFYSHFGFDWTEIKDAVFDDLEEGRVRGASTLTQQLVKNLFFTTHGSLLRKAAEASLVVPAELILGKRRILELYLNAAEWGPGIFGAEAAARYHYNTTAARLTREQAARLAAILPSPRRRKPARMDKYTAEILKRMDQMGW
jgi:monofunctional biosynthetic peptidoglycan transglycosylase